ncbi:curli assembly protein CsgG [bacterium]|nr:curli assembly protein CsgG [bacterium]
MKTRMVQIVVTLLASVMTLSALAAEPIQPLTVAVFDFESRDEAVKDLGPKVAVMINALLSADPRLILVERAELEKALGEMEIGLSGTVDPASAAKVGHLTGAKVLVTGRVFRIDRETVMVAKIIGTETSRVYGEMVKGPGGESPANLSGELAKQIADTIEKKADTLVARVESADDRIAKIKKAIGGRKKLPLVEVRVAERHFGGMTIDPAAETELQFILQKCGFTVVDEKTREKPDVEIVGEAFSEFGMRKGNLVSCKARVELKLRSLPDGEVIAVDRQTSVAVDISEQMAAKTALQQAAAELAERLIPLAAK